MADFNSILQEDTTNVNMSGSNIKPYALSNEDIAKDTPANLEDANSEETLAAPTQQELPLENIKITPSEQEQQTQQQEQQLQQEQDKVNLDVSQQITENQPPLTWDTAREDQKLYINSEKGGSTFYEFYVPELDKVINTNTTDTKEINRQIALSNAKTQEERNFIFNSSYFDDKLVVYTGPKNNLLTTALKGVGSTTVDAIKGAVQFVVANKANNKIKNLERLMDQLSSLTLTPQMKEMYMTASDISAAGAGFYSLSTEEQQEFLKEAYKRYKENINKQAEKEVESMPTNDMIAQEAMFKKLIKDPLETLQNKDNDENSTKKYLEFLNKNKEYISPSLLKNQEKLEQEFKNDAFFAQMHNEAKVKLTELADLSNQFKEAVHLNYLPEIDNPYAYQAGQLGFSYAGQLVALATGHFELAGVFAASQFGDTIDKAIEKGLPLDIATDAANKTALFQYVTEKIQLSLFRANFASLSKYISVGMLNTVAENALQEGVQDFGTKAIEQFYGVDSFTVEDYILDFCVNAGIGALMSVPMGAIVAHSKAKYVNAFTQKFPSIKKEDAIALADKVISYGTQTLSTTEGKNALYQGIMDMTRNIADTSIQSKSSDNVNEQDLKSVQNAAYEYLIQPISKEQKMKYMQDSKSAENFTKKYLVEQVGMFDAEATELSKGLKNLYSSLQMTTGMSQRQIAERMLPNSINMMAVSALSNYKYVDNKNDFIKFESSVLKTIFKNLGPIDHLTDADFLNMAKDVINGMPLTEVADKYRVLYQPEKYDLIRNQMLIDKIDKTSFAVMLASSNIKDKELIDSLQALITTNPNSEQYIRLLNDFNIKLNEALNNKSIAGALFANNNELSNPVAAFNTLFLNKPIAGVDIHEVGHFFDIVFYANQMCAKLGLPTTSFNIKIMNLYNALGRKITGKSDFVYNPFDYESTDQIKVAEALPNIMADYLIKGKEYDKDSAELVKYISLLYKYINSTTAVTSEYADTKEAKELVQEIQKQEKEDELSVALDKLLKLADTGDFNNQDIYNIVKDIKLNEALKLTLYIEKGQHPVITLIQAINDINNTRVDSMYRKSIDYNQDIIPSKNLIIPENAIGGQDQERIRENVEKAKATWNDSSKNIHTIRHIYNKYNTYLNKEGKWNYVVSDKDIKFNEGNMEMLANKAKLGMEDDNDGNVRIELKELIGHKELFQSINSSFFNTVVAFSDNVDEPRVVIEGSAPLIYLPKRLITSNSNDSRTELKSELVYGMQQAIDTYFNVAEATDIEKELYNIIRNQKISDPKYAQNLLAALTNQRLTQRLSEEQQKVYDTLSQALEKAISRFNNNIGVNRAEYSASNMDKKFFDLFETLPKDVYSFSHDLADKSLKIPTKYMIVPEKSLKDNSYSKDMINQANQLRNKGESNKQIYESTLSYLDKNNNNNIVISDKNAKINEDILADIKKYLTGKMDTSEFIDFTDKLYLKKVLNHKDLYKEINLRSNPQIFFADMPEGFNGGFDKGSGNFVFNKKYMLSLLSKGDDVFASEFRTMLLHETQHLIDFESGNYDNSVGTTAEIMQYLSKHPEFNNDIKKLKDKSWELYHKIQDKKATPDEVAQYKELEKVFDSYINNQLEKRAYGTQNDSLKSTLDLVHAGIPEHIKSEISDNNKKESFEKVTQEQKEQEEQNLNLTVSDIMGDNFSKTFAVVSEVLKKDSPKLFAHSRSAMFKSMQDVKRYKQQAKDLVIEINKMSPEDKLAFKKAWNNRDFAGLINIADKYDIRQNLVAIRATLNELHQIVASSFEGESYNQLLGYLQDYFPRLVIDHDGLASYLVAKKSNKGTVETDTSETANNKFDKWMDKVKNWLEDDLNYSKKKVGSPYFYKQRQIEIVDDNMLEFYAEPADAFDNYINRVQDILFRKYFFGDGYVKEFMNSADTGKKITSINGIDYVIPNWKERVRKMGFLTGDKATDKRILDAIESVFFRGDTGSFGAIYRTATNILTINSFFSALSNLGDLALTLYNYGLKNTMSAIKDVALKDAQVTTEDLGIEDLYEEFKADGTKLKKVFNAVMKWSGFKYLDIFTKDVNIQAALLSAKETLKSSGEKTDALIDKIYMYMGGDEEAANALIANLINDNWKDQDVKLFAFNELSNQQPITKLEVPEFYNKYPQFRVLYLYKTFAVKQLNFAYANVLADIKNNPKEGFKKLIRFMAWLMAVGVTKDIIADMLKGKEIHLTDSAMFSITSFFFLNEYNYYTFKNKGAIMGVFHMVMPPVPLMTEISSDVKRASKGKIDNPFQLKTMRGVPVVGKPFQYWFGD